MTDAPATWEADVVLNDGGTVHLRPIRPDDADRLREFHSRLSQQTVFNRYFAYRPTLSDQDVHHFTHVDHATRVIKAAADEVWHSGEVGPSVLEEPEVWGVEGFGPTGIAIRLVVKTQPADQWKVLRELRSRVKVALDQEGIGFGFQRIPWSGEPVPTATPRPG